MRFLVLRVFCRFQKRPQPPAPVPFPLSRLFPPGVLRFFCTRARRSASPRRVALLSSFFPRLSLSLFAEFSSYMLVHFSDFSIFSPFSFHFMHLQPSPVPSRSGSKTAARRTKPPRPILQRCRPAGPHGREAVQFSEKRARNWRVRSSRGWLMTSSGRPCSTM